LESASGQPVTAYATYVNAGLRGSRFMGACEVAGSSGVVRLTGHRMPVWLTRVRAVCYVLFVPWVFVTIAAIGAVYDRYPGWSWVLAVAAPLTAAILLGIGVGDLWVTYRGPVETVTWRAAEATPLAFGRDTTRGPGIVIDEVVKVRAPIGPQGERRLLVLRTPMINAEALVQVFAGGAPGSA
jgi:hypothetical protein